MTGSAGRNRDIEILRAVAIACVLATHWVPHFLARFGTVAVGFTRYTGLHAGVDLFFCISGYVIASSSLTASGSTRSLRDFGVPFWIRRVFRLWPSAWLWALVPLILSVCWNRNGAFGAPDAALRDAIAALINIANLHDWQCLQTEDCGPLGVYWSLSLEEQFYWIFPLLLIALSRRKLLWCLAALALLQIVVPRPDSFVSQPPSLLWLIRTDAICLGILIAMLRREPAASDAVSPALRRAGLPLGVLLLAALATIAAPAWSAPHATGLIALVSAGLVWMASFDAGLILPRSPLDGLLLWLGSRSYSLYLIHATAGRFASELRDRLVAAHPHALGPLVVFFGAGTTILLTLALAEANFRWLETPLRARGRHLARVWTERTRRERTEPVPATM